MSLKGSPSSRGSVGCGGAGGRGGARGGAGGVKARFLSGGSPRFLVDSLLLSMTRCDLGKNDLTRQSHRLREAPEFTNTKAAVSLDSERLV